MMHNKISHMLRNVIMNPPLDQGIWKSISCGRQAVLGKFPPGTWSCVFSLAFVLPSALSIYHRQPRNAEFVYNCNYPKVGNFTQTDNIYIDL